MNAHEACHSGYYSIIQPSGEVIAKLFILALYGERVNKTICLLVALPVKTDGLAITNPITTYSTNYTTNTLLCLHLSQAIQGKIAIGTVTRGSNYYCSEDTPCLHTTQFGR